MTVIADRRGVAALEFGVIALVIIGMLMPISDLVIAALKYVTAYQALRDLGAYAQYHVPPDVTNLASWTLPTIAGYSINAAVMCGAAATACSTSNTASPKWFTFSTAVVITPLFPAVVPGLAGTRTISYSERFQ